MLDYKTCVALKASGFDQTFVMGDYGYAETDLKEVHGWIDFKKGQLSFYDGSGEYGCGDSEEGFLRVPTLSGLIEACGERFNYLLCAEDHTWVCNSYPEGVRDQYGDEVGYGKTAEEAVARLYLELNKKITMNHCDPNCQCNKFHDGDICICECVEE